MDRSEFDQRLASMHDHERRLAASLNKASAAARVAEKRSGELERRNADLEAKAALQVYEPPLYGPGSGHSWFADTMRVTRKYGDGDGGQKGAGERLRRHHEWQHRDNERSLQARTANAQHAAERALSQTRQEASLLQRWQAEGGILFDVKKRMRDLEQLSATGVDGQGGYLGGPPGWLVDQFIHAPRAGAPFAALWTSLPLPPHVSSVNLPRFFTGTRTGPQIAQAGPATSFDLTDSAVLNATVRTLAGTVDVSMQWLDQIPVPIDDTIGADLIEDFATNLDGQLLLGSGANGQLTGIVPTGVPAAANMVCLQSTTNVASMSWSNGGGSTAAIAGSLHQATAQLYSKISRYRALEPTHWVVPASVWAIIAGSGVDSSDRPLILPGMQQRGTVKMLHGLPVVVDENIVETWGGTTPPSMGNVSAGRLSPTDGSGTWVPIFLGRWPDCLYFQSEPVVRIMPEGISGSGQVRFQVYSYVTAMPGRVIWAGTSQTFSGTNQGGGVNASAPVSYGAVTNFVTNSILQPASAGY